MFLQGIIVLRQFVRLKLISTKIKRHENAKNCLLDSNRLINFINVILGFHVFFKHEMIKEAFTTFGYPTYIIYPLATLKLLGLGVIISNKGGALKEWAYAGFFFDFVLAFFAHYMISDGQQSLAIVGLVVLLASYFHGKKVRP